MSTMGEKFKKLIGIDDYDDYDDYEEDYVEPQPAKKTDIDDYSSDYARFQRDNYRQRDNIKDDRDRKVVDFNQRVKMRLIVNEPAAFDDCSKIVDNLKNKKPVIINLEKIETELAKRIFDFVSGATYALDGSVQKVANNIFVFAPDNVDISSNIEEFKTLTKGNLFQPKGDF